jgi:hypothetical protein
VAKVDGGCADGVAGDGLVSDCLDLFRGEQPRTLGFPTAAEFMEQELVAFVAALPSKNGWRVVPPRGQTWQRFRRFAPYLKALGFKVEQENRHTRILIQMPPEIIAAARPPVESARAGLTQGREADFPFSENESKEKLYIGDI